MGSVSFREGIDVPGEGLTQVIIDRIPFPHPADPVLVTRKILEGPDMFFDIVLPRAKLLQKQAAGRLIRSKSDRGRVVILDGRVLSKRGWRITDALPGVKYRRVEVELGKRSEGLTARTIDPDRRHPPTTTLFGSLHILSPQVLLYQLPSNRKSNEKL